MAARVPEFGRSLCAKYGESNKDENMKVRCRTVRVVEDRFDNNDRRREH